MQQKTIEKCERARDLMDKGVTYQEAIKQVGLGSATFYEYKKANGLITKKHKKNKPRSMFIDIPSEPVKEAKIAVVFCTAKDISTVLMRGLA